MPTRAVVLGLLVMMAACSAAPPRPPAPTRERTVEAPPEQPPSRPVVFEVTAYSIEGTTASGTRARAGIVAADPRVVPLGSRVRLLGAGAYSGVYRVEDTGRAIKGRELDVYLRDDAEAKRFGRRRLRVEILERGETAER